MIRASRVVAILVVAAALAGCSDRGELITLVQRVALTPGVDALDPIDPVPAGTDLEKVEFFLTEPLTPESAEAFDPAVHLSLGGLALSSFSFNTASDGTIPPYAHLTVNLAVGAGGVPEGSYHLKLISLGDHRLEGASSTLYLGEYEFSISVVPRDHKLPYIVRFRPQQLDGVPDELPTETWMAVALLGGGIVPHGDRIAPHASLRAEFSERMRTPLTVGGGPEVFVEKFFQTSFGEQRVLLGEIVGVDFQPSIQPVTWDDTLDGPHSEFVTVMTSETVEGLEIATDYLLEFPGAGPLTSMQPAVRDRSGEPLTFRFANDEEARKIAITDRRGFTTAPIRINTPAHKNFLNAAAFLAGDLTLAVGGEVADFLDAGSVSDVLLEVRPAGSSSIDSATVAPTVTDEFNLTGVAIDRFSGLLRLPAAGADGDYELLAEARSLDGESLGADVIRLIKDTAPPTVIGSATFEIAASDDEVVGFCVTASTDTVRAEILVPGNTVPIAGTSAFSEVFLANPFGVFRQFCFDPFDVPQTFHVGENVWVVQLTDMAGNVSTTIGALRIRPELVAMSPSFLDYRGNNFEDVLVLSGTGLERFPLNASNTVVIDGRAASISDVSADLHPFPSPGHVAASSLSFRVYDPVSAGRISVVIDGVESNRLGVGVCRVEAGKFVASRNFAVPNSFGLVDGNEKPRDFLESVNFALERDELGEPILAWSEYGDSLVGVALAGPPSIPGEGYATNRPQHPSVGDPEIRRGNLVALYRRSDGSVMTTWVATGSGAAVLRTDDPDIPPLPLGAVGTPRSLTVEFDPWTGLPVALIVSSSVQDAGQFGLFSVLTVQVVSLSAEPSILFQDTQHTGSHGAYTGALLLDVSGAGWILAGGGRAVPGGTVTYAWRRSGGTWFDSDLLPGTVAAAAASPDGSRFLAVFWNVDDVSALGESNVGGSIRLLSTASSSAIWLQDWSESLTIRPRAFRPPPSSESVGHPLHHLASSAALGIAPDGTPRLAFFDPDRLSLRLLRNTQIPAVIDLLDIDTNIGHRVEMVLDGNGEALVAYLDLSNTDAFVDSDPENPEDPEVSPRTTVSIQLVDTRNRNAVVAGAPQSVSACSPDVFRTSFVSADAWREIREDQAGNTRSVFDFFPLALSFNLLTPASTDQGQRLQAIQGTVAVLSRLLEHGSLSFRGTAASAGSAAPGTVDSGAQLLETPSGEELEVRGLRVPVGTRSVKVTEFDTPDDPISEIHLAVFDPVEAPSVCDPDPDDDTPAPRPMGLTSAAIAYDTVSDALILFGGRDAEGELRGETWELSGPGPCWIRRAAGPQARTGHVMGAAPNGLGVVLFGGVTEDTAGNPVLLDDTWLFDTQEGSWAELTPADHPSARGQATVAFDDVRRRLWLFGGETATGLNDELWYLEIDTSTIPVTLEWVQQTSVSSPERRKAAALAFDPVSRKLVLFGGEDRGVVVTPPANDPGRVRNDLWAFDVDDDQPALSDWNRLAIDQRDQQFVGPAQQYIAAARAGGSAFVSPTTGELVVFGGLSQGFGLRSFFLSEPFHQIPSNTIDLLELKDYLDGIPGNDPPLNLPPWSFLVNQRAPTPRLGQAATFDHSSRRLLVFGGVFLGDTLDDTVELAASGLGWASTFPGLTEPKDLLLLGRDPDGMRVQWARADALPLFDIPAAAQVLGKLAGAGEFPPIVDEFGSNERYEFRTNEYALGPIEFDKLMQIGSTHPQDPKAKQGVLESHAKLGSLRAEGSISLDLDNSGTTDVFTGFDLTTRIPTLHTVSCHFEGAELICEDHDTGIPVPELCDLALNFSTPDSFLMRIPMEASFDSAPSIDHRGPTKEELLEDPVLALQSFTWVTGVTTELDVDVDVPICVNVHNVNFPLLNASVRVPFISHILDISRAALALTPLPAGPDVSRGGPLASAGELAGPIVVDAFTHPFYGFGSTGQGLRNLDFLAVTDPSTPIPTLHHDEPEWLLLHDDGISFGLRRGTVTVFPVPLAGAP